MDKKINDAMQNGGAGKGQNFARKVNFARKAGSVPARLYDSSLTSLVAQGLRRGFLKLRLRVVGVFFATFGIYSLIVSLLMNFFTDAGTSDTTVFFGVGMAIISAPLLLSGGNVSTALINSKTGAVICTFLGIRSEAVAEYELRGNLNVGFAAGVLCGSLTFAVSPREIISCLFMCFICLVILCVPETGPVFSVLGLLTCGTVYHCIIIPTTLVSLIIKLLRGKRSLSLNRSHLAVAVFALCVGAGFVLSPVSGSVSLMLRYLLGILEYFLVVILFCDCRAITRLAAVAGAVGGVISSIYIMGRVLDASLPESLVPSKDFLSATVSSLPAFSDGWACVAIAAMIPLAAGLAVRRYEHVSRLTMCLCAAAMTAALVLMGEYYCVAAAAAAVCILLLLVGCKKLNLTLILCADALLAASFTERIGSRLSQSMLSKMFSAEALYAEFAGEETADVHEYILCGRGFALSEAGGNVTNFYLRTVDAIGYAGLAVMILTLAVIALGFVKLCRKTVGSDAVQKEMHRFGAVKSAANTRIGAGAPLAACASMLMCAAFHDLWASPDAIMLLWLLCGMCAAYTASATAEITKAEMAEEMLMSPEGAAVDIKCLP